MSNSSNTKTTSSSSNRLFPLDCFTLPAPYPSHRRYHSLSAPSPISFVVNNMAREVKREYEIQNRNQFPRTNLSTNLVRSNIKNHIFHEIEAKYKSAGLIPYVTNVDGSVSVLMQIGNGCGYDKNTDLQQTTTITKPQKTTSLEQQEIEIEKEEEEEKKEENKETMSSSSSSSNRSNDMITDFGGKREVFDKSSIHCAVREFFEEVGQELAPYFTPKACIQHLQYLRDSNQLHYVFNRKGGYYVVYFLPVYHDAAHFNKFNTCKTRNLFPIRTSVQSYDGFDVQGKIVRDKPEEGVRPIWIDTNELIGFIDKDYKTIHPRIRVTNLMKRILAKI